MQPLRCALIALTALTVPAAARAVTVPDIIALSKAGVADVILTALIDADRTIFTLSGEQILDLREAGVSDVVVLKMIGSRREFEPPPPPERGPGGPLIAVSETALPSNIVAVATPYYVPVPIFINTHTHERDGGRTAAHGNRRKRPALPPGTIRNGEFVR